jgi:hypothetical protein
LLASNARPTTIEKRYLRDPLLRKKKEREIKESKENTKLTF